MGTRKNRLGEAVLTSTTIYVLIRNMKNIRFFYLKTFSFLSVKFSIYLNSSVFVILIWCARMEIPVCLFTVCPAFSINVIIQNTMPMGGDNLRVCHFS